MPAGSEIPLFFISAEAFISSLFFEFCWWVSRIIFTHTHMHTHVHTHSSPLYVGMCMLQWDQKIRAAGYRENVKYTSFSWTSDSYFLPHKIDQAHRKINAKSHSWSSTAWTWMYKQLEVVCCLIQRFWMRGISCEQRNKQTKKVVENCRFSRIPEMV